MGFLPDHAGYWIGTNQLQLMPGDSPHVADATSQVSTAAAGTLTTIAYTWEHPEDGVQDGLLVVGRKDEAPGALTFWGDSWHQQPEPVVLLGALEDGLLVVSYAYGGDWRWEIVVDATDPQVMALRMNNIVPESAATEAIGAGAYAAMVAELRRAPSE